MKRLLLVITVAVLAYSGWWFHAAQSLKSDIETWFADRRSAGWQADYSDITVRGFPNRTDLTLTDVALRSPEGSVGWQAPFFQVLGLSYKTGHVIIAWPDNQTLTSAGRTYDLTSDGLRASVVHEDGAILRSNLEAATLNIAGPDGALAMAGLNAALQRVEPATSDYRLALSIDSLARSDPAITGTRTPESLASLRADLTASLDSALTLGNFANPPNPTALALRTAEARYGQLTLRAAADTWFSRDGMATGEITIAAENWRESLDAARQNGDLPPVLADGMTDLLNMIASLSGSRDALDITLRLQSGMAFLGPVPLGFLPALRWD